MKPYEHFVENILGAVRAGQGKDPLAATAIIQEALKSAGLLKNSAAPAPAASPEPAAAGKAAFVDLNPPPDWAAKLRQQAAAPEAAFSATGAGAEAMQDWMTRLKARMPGPLSPGQGRTVDPAAHGPGQFLHGSYSSDAGTRRYRLYVPAKAASGPRPLVVMLHGCKQDPEDFAAGTTMNLAAEDSGCLVLYPEQPASANHTQCWNWFDAAHQQRGRGEPALIAGMTQQVLREHDGDAGRVYVAGLSAGGAMAAVMAATYPELYAAAGIHSGLPAGAAHDLMSGLNAMKGAGKMKRHGAAVNKPVRTIVFHGDRDAVVHPSNGQSVYRQFTHGAPLREVEDRGQGHTKTSALDGDGKVMAEHWTLHGAGHAWSGGSSAGSYAESGGPNASAHMLQFFLGH